MTTISIQLPQDLKSYLEQEVGRRGYKDPSEFVRDLLAAEKRRSVAQEVEQILLEAADGPFTDWTDDDVEDIRRTGERIIQRRKRA